MDDKNIDHKNQPIGEYISHMTQEHEEGNFQMLLHQIAHLTKIYTSRFLKDTDLHPGQVGMLFLIRKKGTLSQKELANFLHLTPPTMTVAIQKLEKNEYITRKPDEKDQRIMRLGITKKGNDTLKQIEGLSAHIDSTLFRNMTIEERIVLRRLLNQVRDNLLEQSAKEGWECRPPFLKEENHE